MKKSLLTLSCLSYCFLAAAQPYTLLDTKTNQPSGIEVILPSPDGKYLLSGDLAGNVYFYNTSDFSVADSIKAHKSTVNSISFSASGKYFLTAGEDGEAKLWDYETRECTRYTKAPYTRVNFAVLPPDEKYIYYGGYSISYYDTVFTSLIRASVASPYTKRSVFDFESRLNKYGITDGIMDYSGKYVIFSAGYEIYFWDPVLNKLAFVVPTGYSVNNITSIENNLYAWADGNIIHWEWNGTRYVFKKAISAGTGGDVGYSRIVPNSDRTLLASGNDGNLVNLYSASSLSLNQVISGHTDVVRAFAFLHSDSVLVTASYDGTIKVWGYPKPEPEPEDTTEIVPVDTVVEVIPEPRIIDTTIVYNENNIPVAVKNRPVEKQGTFSVASEYVEVLVWDNSKIDGDSISLNINGEWVLENYPVVKEKKSIRIQIKPNTNNYLILYAHNVGSSPPNTAAVMVISGGVEQTLLLSSTLKKCGALNFEYKKDP